MKFYLSSYKIGYETKRLQELTQDGNKKIAYISNALDYSMDLERRKKSEESDISDLKSLGFYVDLLDLRHYFNKSKDLEERINEYDVIWVRGGNCFVLLQAMRLSGFDKIIKDYFKNNKDIVYGGYSAGICILGPTLKGIHLTDDPSQKPYGEEYNAIWEGLGILEYVIAPHYRSNHPESEDIEKSIQYMIDNKILFKALKDGEVIIVEQLTQQKGKSFTLESNEEEQIYLDI